MSAHERAVEAQELLAKFSASQQLGPLVRIMASDAACYTQGGRINCAAIGRELGVNANEVRSMLGEIKATLGSY